MAVRLFVGNLPYEATEADLREHFSAVGPLSFISMPVDRETGKPRGFAFIEFTERAQAEEAIKRFNNQAFKGRTIAVNEARPKDDRPSARPATGAPRPTFGVPEAAPPARADGRAFGPDAAPRGKRKAQKSSARSERGPKRPIRERPGGQLFLGGDEDDTHEDDVDGENFASRENESDFQDTERQ